MILPHGYCTAGRYRKRRQRKRQVFPGVSDCQKHLEGVGGAAAPLTAIVSGGFAAGAGCFQLC